MEIKIKIEGLEGPIKELNLEDILNKIKGPRYGVETLPCKGPKHEYRRVNALVIVDKENKYSTEVRCVRYEKGDCDKSKTEPSGSEQKDEPLLGCIYRPHKNKGNDKVD